jgi:hypothetical protein
MFILILSLLSSLHAQDIEDRRLFMPRSLAMCGAMESRININESLYFNPASSAHSRMFSADTGFTWQHDKEMSGRSDTYYVNAVDTENEMFGGGVGYYKRYVGGIGSEWDVRGMFNKLLVGNRLGLGVGIHYTKFNHRINPTSNLNADFGFIFLLTKKTLIGGTAYNLIGDNNNINTRSIDLGIRHTMWDFFSATFDFEHRFIKKTTFTGALELLYKNGIMITVSTQKNMNLGNIFWGLGLGYVGPKISLIYGTMNAATAPYSFTHSFSLRVFF